MLEVDINGNFDNEDFIDRKTTLLDGTEIFVTKENGRLTENVKKIGKPEVTTVYNGDNIQDLDSKKLNRLKQNDVYYDGKGNTYVQINAGETAQIMADRINKKRAAGSQIVTAQQIIELNPNLVKKNGEFVLQKFENGVKGLEDKFRINKNISSKNSDIGVIDACRIFLDIKQKTMTETSFQTYKTFVYAQIIPYFKKFKLKEITIPDIENFRKYLQENKKSERRIKNILCLLNQIIKHFQNEGYIDKTCVFEVKRIADIPKRQIQILTSEQLSQLFKILKKKYLYMLPIVQNLITLKQPLNTFLTGSEQQMKSLKRKIRKDFYKVKQELGLINYMFDDLRFCQKCVN